MKRIFSSFVLLMAIAGVAHAGPVEDINAFFVQKLQSFNWDKPAEQSTLKASLVLSDLVVTGDAVSKMNLTYLYSRSEKGKSIESTLNLQYENNLQTNPASVPQLKVKIGMSSEYLAAIAQSFMSFGSTTQKVTSEGLANFLIKMTTGMAQTFFEPPLVPLISQHASIDRNAAGVFTGAKGDVSVSLDQTNPVPPELLSTIPFTSAAVTFSVDPQNSTIDLAVGMNPAYPAFAKDGQGLKEEVDKLLSQSPNTADQLISIFSTFHGIADAYFGVGENAPE